MNEGRAHTYPVQAAARLTGLSADTLRAWERRYGAVVPQRVGRGRAYSRDDIARLRLLRVAVQHGHAIGAVALLSNAAVEALLHPDPAPSLRGDEPAAQATQSTGAVTETLIDALRHYDASLVEREFGRLAATLRPSALVLDVVLPALRVVGDECQREQMRPAQEHVLSAIVRQVLGGMLRLLSGIERPRRVVFATLPGERHEFGILSGAVLAAAADIGVLYLGPDLPVEDIAEAAMRSDASLVVVGLTAMPRAEARNHLLALRGRLPETVAVWAGGPAALPVRGVQLSVSLEQFVLDLAAYRPIYRPAAVHAPESRSSISGA